MRTSFLQVNSKFCGTAKKRKQWQPVRVVGLDGAYVQGSRETQPVLVAVGMGTGR
jgi:hypothetical protein